MIEFKHAIEKADINHKLNHELSADPNLNYEILDKEILAVGGSRFNSSSYFSKIA